MKKAEIIEPKETQDTSFVPVIKNEVDDPNVLSVSSVSPLPESADEVKPVEAPAKAENPEGEEATPEPEAPAEPEEGKKEPPQEPEKPEEPKAKDPVQKRIDELTRKRRDEERARLKTEKLLEESDAEVARLREELKAAKRAVPAKDKPKAEDFETDAEFVEALTDWKVEQALKEKEDAVTTEAAKGQKEKEIDQTDSDLDLKMEKGREKYADFNELVLHEDLKISPVMVEAILLTDNDKVEAEDILYYLGKHPEESAKIAKLSPLKAAGEIGKIEAKLSAPPPPKKITQAPEPITPVKTTGATELDPSKMTPKEYKAWRESNK